MSLLVILTVVYAALGIMGCATLTKTPKSTTSGRRSLSRVRIMVSPSTASHETLEQPGQ